MSYYFQKITTNIPLIIYHYTHQTFNMYFLKYQPINLNMKKLSIIFFSICVLTACSSGETTTESSAAATEAGAGNEQEADAKPISAVCVWDNLSVRAQPNAKSKWLTSISIGESLTMLGEYAVDSADNNRQYVKVALADGKEGWTQSLLVIEDGTAAVFVQDVSIYKRPDLLTKSDKSFSQMDIVAIKGVQDDWVEVTGKRLEGNWIETGWVKKESLSSQAVDIATAKFARLALNEQDPDKRIQALKDIVENADFSGSTFMPRLQGELEGLLVDPLAAPAEQPAEEE